MEFIYIIANDSYSKNLVKIGRTKLMNPEERIKQLYWGETGVPEHFTPILFLQVPDCIYAERVIHERLSSYRKNKKREFFLLTPEVSKSVVIDICSKLFDKEYIKIMDDFSQNEQHEICDGNINEESFFQIDIRLLGSLPIHTSILSDEQKSRAFIIESVLNSYFDKEHESWLDSMSRDENPEREIFIWEHIVKAYLKVTSDVLINEKHAYEVYKILLERSLMSHTKVLKRHKNSCLSKTMIKKVMSYYTLKPKPIIIR